MPREISPRLFSVADVEHVVEVGLFASKGRSELLNGVPLRMSQEGNFHATPIPMALPMLATRLDAIGASS